MSDTSSSENDSEKPTKQAMKSLKLKNNELVEENEALEEDVKKLKEKIKDYKKKIKEKNKEIVGLQEKLQEKNEKEEEEEEKKGPQPKKGTVEKSSQYDIVVKINSLVAAATDGWVVQFKNKDKEAIEKKFLLEQVAVGVMGRENVGKTFLVNKICGEKFASGYYTNTESLSIKYCTGEDKQHVKVLLDSAGMNSAIFFFNFYEAEMYNKSIEKKLSVQEYERIKVLMINDRCMTEYFIQNFILDSCHVILIIVELLSQNDQKMIERIKHLYAAKKTIIIVHNLFKLEAKDEVLDRATLEIEGAFLVKKQIIPGSDVPYYIEKQQSGDMKNKNNIVHLIMGKEGCSSGDFFNKASLGHLIKFNETGTEISKFDLLQKLNDYFQEKHRLYINNCFDSTKIPKFQLFSKADSEEAGKKGKKSKSKETWHYKLDYQQQLDLKQPEFNVLGTLKDIDINYHMYTNNKLQSREKIYFFELPGCKEKPEISLKRLAKEGEQVLTLTITTAEMNNLDGFKPDIGGLVPGNFIKKIKINDDFGEYICDKKYTALENGILRMRFTQREDELL